MRDFFAAAASGSIAEAITTPIFIMKTQYQLHRPIHMKTLARTTTAAVGTQMLSTGISLPIYREINRQMEINTFAGRVCSGALSGIAASVAVNPANVYKICQAAGEKFHLRNIYKGYPQLASKYLLLNTFRMPVYDFYRQYLPPSGAAAAQCLTTSAFVYPLEFWMARTICNESLQMRTFRGIYRGYWIQLVRIIPHFAITMSVYEHLTGEKKNK